MKTSLIQALAGADYAVIAVYAALVAALGLFFSRGSKGADDYFIGGRSLGGLVVGLSIFSAAFSALSFVLLPREGAFRNWSFMSVMLFIPLVITPLLAFLFVPLYLRLGLRSVYEYLEIRFHPALRRLGALLFLGYAFGWMGSMLYALGLIVDSIAGLTPLQFYAVMAAVGGAAMLYAGCGGLKGIVWLDVFQTLTLGGSVVAILLLTLSRVDGGLGAVWEIGQASSKFNPASLRLPPTEQTSLCWIAVMGLFVYLPGYATSQVTVQRYLCMPSLREARRALVLNAIASTLVCALFMLLGTAIFVYYRQQAGALPTLSSEDKILPHFLVNDLRVPGVTGLMLASLFAAAMGTLNGGINSIAAISVYDLLGGRATTARFNRNLSFAIGLGIVVAAMVVPLVGKHVIDMITAVASTFLGLLLGIYMLGMLSRRANTGGAVAGVLAGVAGLTFAVLHPAVPSWWSGAFVFAPTVAVGVCASYLFPPPTLAQRRGVFIS